MMVGEGVIVVVVLVGIVDVGCGRDGGRGGGSDRVGYFFLFIVPWVLSSSSGFGLAGPPLCLPVPKNPSVKSAYNEFFRLIVLLWAPK